MKKFILALVAMVTMTCTTASAMSYEQARQQALFLTDKMAYELNLTDDQYEAAYEVNLDYLMGVNTYDDLYGIYWRQRNMDLNYILLDWQYQAYLNATYFYRPLYWNAGYWHFGVYARYPYRDYFFFGRPTVYIEYRGGHSWHMNGGRSWYRDRRICPPHHNNYFGMRDGFRRGDFGNGYSGNPSSRTQFGTAQRPPMMNNGTMSFGNANRNNSSFGNANRNNSSFGNANRNNSFGNGNVNGNNAQFGSGRRSSASSRGNSAFGSNGRESSTRSTVGNSQSTFGSRRSGSTTSTPRNTFSPSRSEGSSSSSGSSFGSGRRSSSSFGGGRGSSSFGSNSRPSAPSVAPSRGNSSFGGGHSGGSSFGGGRSGGSSFGGGNHGGGGHGSFGSRR